jgi:phosphatidylglycerophosphate synthase
MSGPSLAELKATGQPPSVVARLNDEHWAGRLYMRRISPHATWVFARLGWSPNAVTLAFIACGVAAGVVAALGGLVTAFATAAAIQLYLLFDCSDGELARWSGRTSATGAYLDGIGHYLGEAALLTGLGIRAQGHVTFTGGYVTAGVAAALLSALVKAETDNVIVARAKAGLSVAGVNGLGVNGLSGTHADDVLAPVGPGMARARRLAAALRLHRVIQAVELSMLILIAAIVDAAVGGLAATRVLTAACLVIAALMVVAHLVAIVASRRLR